MEDWQSFGSGLVLAAAQKDEIYLQLQRSLEQAEKAYLSVFSLLDPQQQQIIDRYIALCEEIGYYETQLAWKWGQLQK
jgi:hypothetical protein